MTALPPTACPDWAERLQRRQVPMNRAALPLRTPEAKRFGAIFDQLRVGDIPGFPRTSDLPNFGWLRDIGCAIWGGDVIREALICCPKKSAKALPLNTPVATPDGYTTIAKVEPGDMVLAPDGTPTRVLDKSPVFLGNPCYEVEFSTGEKIVADAGHRWFVECHAERMAARNAEESRQRRPHGRVIDKAAVRAAQDAVPPRFRTTAELAERVRYYDGARYHINNWRMCLPAPLDLPDAPLPLDPYILGYWIGNGHRGVTAVSCHRGDADHVEVEFAEAGFALSSMHTDHPRTRGETLRFGMDNAVRRCATTGAYTGHAPPGTLRHGLTAAGVIDRKHIPAAYMRGSIAQRRALLQGLMDSDGTVSCGASAPRASFAQSDKAIAEAVAELVASLGMKPSFRERRAKLDGRDMGPCYEVAFTAYREDAPFRLPRKLDALAPRPDRPTRAAHRQIVAVRPVPSVPTQCVRVASPTQQFLIGRTLIPTGNSSGASLLFLAAFLADQHPNQTYSILAPSVGIASICFDAIASAIDADPTLRDLLHVRPYVREIESRKTGSKLSVKAFEKSSATGLKGSVLIDESWLLGEKANATKMRAQIRGALAASPTAKIVHISTTSDDVPRGMWAEQLSYARAVRDGDIHDPAFLPVIYEPWKGCDPWNDESVWPCLMPSYPHIAGPEFYRSVIREANAAGPAAIARDKAQFFNLSPLTASAGADGWVVANMLADLSGPLTVADLFTRAEVIAAGVDLGGLADLSAITFLGVQPDGHWLIAARCWASPSVWARNSPIASALDDFTADGDLIRCPPGDDIPGILDLLTRARLTGKLAAVGIDPAGATQLADALDGAEGFEVVADPDNITIAGDVPVIGISQSARSLVTPIRTFERMAEAGRVTLSDQRILGWAFGNVRIARSGAAEYLDRSRPVEKIDPIAALLDAVAAHGVVPKPVAFDVRSFIG